MLICDSESSGFKYEATKIWVVAGKDIRNGRWYFSFDQSVFDEFEVEELVFDELGDYYPCMDHEHLFENMSGFGVCFHNYFQHDKPLIKKFYPWFQPKEEHDSFILSQLFNPDRGKHGLDAWGERFGIPKPKHEEWDRFSPEMLHRVIEDVKINVKVWEALMKEKKEWEDQGGSWDEAIKIEYGIASLQGRQEMHGVKLDIEKAYALADEIYQEIQAIDETLLAQMPPRVVRGSVVDAPFKKDGELKEVVKKWFN